MPLLATALVSLTAAGAAPPSTDRVVRVVDGDTVVLARLGRTRLIGMDTPERGDCLARRATAELARLAPPGARVRVTHDAELRDRFGRVLAYLRRDGRFVNAELVRRGFAVPLTIPPNVAHADRFRRLARQAREAERGLWAPGTCEGEPAPPRSADRDCADFATRGEAQAFFEAQGGPGQDPHRLDGDGDGRACNRLPA